MSYTAQEITEAMSLAQSLSRKIGASMNVIDRAGTLDVVQTVTSLDKVVVRDIKAPRRTHAMISTGCEAETEIQQAMPFIERAIALIETNHGTKIEAEEVVADLLNTVCTWADLDKPGREPGPFTRMFRRVFF